MVKLALKRQLGKANPLMTSLHTITYLDYSNEKSSVGFNMANRTAANFTAQAALIADLGPAVSDLSLGAVERSQTLIEVVNTSATPPADGNAQRERKWLVKYTDNVTGIQYQLEIPVAKVVGAGSVSLLLPQSDMANIDADEWVAFIDALEAGALSPYGNAITFQSAQLVGRNI